MPPKNMDRLIICFLLKVTLPKIEALVAAGVAKLDSIFIRTMIQNLKRPSSSSIAEPQILYTRQSSEDSAPSVHEEKKRRPVTDDLQVEASPKQLLALNTSHVLMLSRSPSSNHKSLSILELQWLMSLAACENLDSPTQPAMFASETSRKPNARY